MNFKKGNPSDWIRRVVKPGDVVIDGGANVGGFALAAAETVGPEGTVIAVEPDPRCHEQLIALTQRHPCVRYVQMALDAKPGTVNLIQGKESPQSSLYERAVKHSIGSVEVTATTLDLLTRQRVAAVKLDLQGCEPAAILGGMNLVQQCQLWCLEVWPHVLQDRLDFILTVFGSAGFTAHGMADGYPEVQYADLLEWNRTQTEPSSHINVVFRRG